MEGAAAGTVEVLGMAALGDGTVTAGAAAGEGEFLSACRQSTSPRPSTIRLRTYPPPYYAPYGYAYPGY